MGPPVRIDPRPGTLVAGPEVISLSRRHCCQLPVENADPAALRQDDATQQVEQGGLAAARRSLEEDPFAGLDGKPGYVENHGSRGVPAELNVLEFDHGPNDPAKRVIPDRLTARRRAFCA